MKFTTQFAIAGCLALTSCQGEIFGGSVDAGELAPPTGETAQELATTQLRRLTRVQYANSVRQLFGIEVDLELLPGDATPGGFSNRGGSDVTTSLAEVGQYDAASSAIASELFGSDAWESFVGCAPEGPDDACVEGFLARTLRRAWRRPATADELGRYKSLVDSLNQTLGGTRLALQFALAAVLQSPNFIYRFEATVSDAGSTLGLRYDDPTIASRLSYLLTDSTPDDELLDAADRGEIATPEVLLQHTRRLLESTSARSALSRFYDEWLDLERLDHLAKNSDVFPEFRPELAHSMRRELELIFEELAFDPARDFMDLFKSNSTHVDAGLATLYGLPSPPSSGFLKVPLPASSHRSGLLTTAGFLAMNARATMTSPTLRGVFIRTELMCESVPPPPPDVSGELPPSPAGVETQRQRLERHRTDPGCAGCHQLMDPMGLALENFDAVGAYRATDFGLPLDVSGDLDGAPFDGPLELAALIHDDPRVAACVARRFGEHALGRELSGSVAGALYDRFAESGHRFTSLVEAVVTSEAFRAPVR